MGEPDGLPCGGRLVVGHPSRTLPRNERESLAGKAPPLPGPPLRCPPVHLTPLASKRCEATTMTRATPGNGLRSQSKRQTTRPTSQREPVAPSAAMGARGVPLCFSSGTRHVRGYLQAFIARRNRDPRTPAGFSQAPRTSTHRRSLGHGHGRSHSGGRVHSYSHRGPHRHRLVRSRLTVVSQETAAFIDRGAK